MRCAFHGSGNREFRKLLKLIESLETMTYPSCTQVLGNARISIPYLARMLSDFFLVGDSANQRLHQVWHLKPYCSPWDVAQIPEVSPKSRCHGIKLKLQSLTKGPHTKNMRQLSPPSPNFMSLGQGSPGNFCRCWVWTWPHLHLANQHADMGTFTYKHRPNDAD